MSNQEQPFGSSPSENIEIPEIAEVDRDAPLVKIAARLKESLEKEYREHRMPKFEFDFYFSAHVAAEDYKNIDTLFQEADIYIPEGVRTSKTFEKDYNAVARGDVDTEGFESFVETKPNPFEKAILRKIYNSGKIVASVDVPTDHDSIKHFRDNARIAGADIFEQFRVGSAQHAEQQGKREEYMIEKLRKKLREIVNSHQNLIDKVKVKVLLSLGSNHVTLYHAFKKAGLETKREFSRLPYIWSYDAEVDRRKLLTRNNPDDDLISRAFIERILRKFINSIPGKLSSLDRDKGSIIFRILIGALSKDEISELVQSDDPFRNFIRKVVSKGLMLPSTDAEADALIEKYAPESKARAK